MTLATAYVSIRNGLRYSDTSLLKISCLSEQSQISNVRDVIGLSSVLRVIFRRTRALFAAFRGCGSREETPTYVDPIERAGCR
jgi:hypothetical protein